MTDGGLRSSLEQELLSRGLATSEAIAEARTQAQLTHETLVEALIARRTLSEDVLVDLFHKRLGFPQVDDTYFDKLDPDTLALIPREVAIAHRVLPLYRSGDKLFIASVDPLDPSLAEVAFAVHHQLIVCIAKPSSILRALSLRYRAPEILQKLSNRRAKQRLQPLEDGSTQLGRPPAPNPPTPPTPVLRGAPILAMPTAVTLPSAPSPPTHALPREEASLAELFRHTPPTINLAPEKRVFANQDDYERARIEAINAPERDSIGRILSLFAARYFPRVVLLAHKQGMLFGWQSVGTDLSATRLRGLIVPLHLPSVFQHTVQNRTYHTGRIDPGMINSAFLAAIGDRPAGHAIIVPIQVERRVATVLYADTAGGEAPKADLSLVYRLCEDTGAALSALIRRQRGGPA